MNKSLVTFQVKVPTKTYLKKYLYKKYTDPLPLNYKYALGTFILSVLENKKYNILMNKNDSSIRISYMQDTVNFCASFKTMAYKGHSINPDKIIAINRYFEDVFIDDLYRFCLERTKGSSGWRPGIDAAIEEFARAFNIIIDTDISFDALKKAEYRHRKKQEEFYRGLSSHQKRTPGTS